jgi:hypothetical protein
MHSRLLEILVAMVLIMLATSCSDVQPGKVDAKSTFKALVDDPIPESVGNIEGGALSLQGYQAYLRFEASGEFLDELATCYKPVKLPSDRASIRAEVQRRFRLDQKAKERLQEELKNWRPWDVAEPAVYESDGPIKNSWTHEGIIIILIDCKHNVVYFKSTGT